MRRLASTIVCLGAVLGARPAAADDAACVAATEQALSLRQQGKLHDALKQLATCSDPTCPDEVKSECTKRLSEIDAVMPTLILAAKDLVGNDLGEVQVTMDGTPLVSHLDGRPVTVDPGEHKFRFTFAPAPPLDKTIVVREGERERHETVTIAISPPKPPSYWTAQRMIGVSTLLVGAATLVVGATFGAVAIAVQNQEKSDCPSAGCLKYEQAYADYNYAQMNASASSVLLVVGGVLAATGLVIWLTAHTPVTLGPTVGTHEGGLLLRGTF